MHTTLKKIKDKYYYFLVEKNRNIRQEYEYYVNNHKKEHSEKPWRHWWLLMRLNWHYRILRQTKPLTQIHAKPSNGGRKLPYENGPESELSKRLLPIHFTMTLLPYDVVSFDIFDTLLLRPFARPVDLFYIIGKRLDMPEFFQLRIDAEKRARELAINRSGSREITIEDIYAIIEEKTGLPKEVGVKTEFEAELQYCAANPYMKQVFRMLQEQNKSIIIVSDMYLPQPMMERLLRKNGYEGYEKLYVSCDYGCNKHQRGLYKYVLRDYPGKKIVHIGDNHYSDIQSAEACGIKAYHYRNVNEIGNPYRADGMTELIGSAYAGIVNMHIHNGTKQYDPYYEYGFIYGGLYVFGFCNWIYQKAKKEGVEKILFLARDGAIYQQIFSKLFPDMPSEYFLWSRIANSRYMFESKRYMAFETIVLGRANSNEVFQIGPMLDSLGLAAIKKVLPQYGLSDNDLVIHEHMDKLQKLFSEHWEEIVAIFKPEKDCLREYIKAKVNNAKKVAIIDVGWLGSGPMALKTLIEKEIKLDCQVFCWQAAALSSPKTNIAANLLDQTIDAYLFSNAYNRNNSDTQVRTNRGLNYMFFEMFTQAVSPTFKNFTSDGRYIFGLSEVENYHLIRSIHKGICDFCEIYRDTFSEDPYIYMISGYDAYLPFRTVIRSLMYFKTNLPQFVFIKQIGDNGQLHNLKTISDYVTEIMD